VGVFIQNHRDDIRASGSGACLEYHTDTDTVHDTAEDGGKELLFQQRTRLHALFDEGGDIDFRLQEGIIAVGIVDEPHENRNGESTDDGLHAEHPAEKIDAEQQQRHVHAEGGHFRFPSPQVVEHHRQAVGASRCEAVRFGEHHGSQRKHETSSQQPAVGDEKINDFFSSDSHIQSFF
jgi:hypothetical protein